jgi:hypothetical protein
VLPVSAKRKRDSVFNSSARRMRASLIVLVLAAGVFARVEVAGGRLAGVVRRWRCAAQQSAAVGSNSRQARLRAWDKSQIVPPSESVLTTNYARARRARQVSGHGFRARDAASARTRCYNEARRRHETPATHILCDAEENATGSPPRADGVRRGLRIQKEIEAARKSGAGATRSCSSSTRTS